MTPENFCYWLQGLFEVGNPTTLTDEQVAMIREHLQLVFTKKTGLSAPEHITPGKIAPWLGDPGFTRPNSAGDPPPHLFQTWC